ncbi:MAG: carbohydrate binding family 9 domain-containing protein [Acidobacteria bacterium]|uniref:Carbohydrate binding family 9 domain-containing protein n=1 Tax=Candidatus Polarisedimenticola svalbardensis TaxID=2886004 RepID=A0A8J6Y2P1_9BACT|nr:carbohydrate binding family 9 domain-containing protein [Candidatus Polarisedimenticola svalbardensis]
MKSLSRAATVICTAILLTLPVYANIPAEADAPVHSVPRASTEIVLDGALDESAWNDALQIELGYEVEPGENIDPPVRTVCLVTYSDRHVYFGFRAYDPDPSKIRARYSDRDRAWEDDWVGIVLDTFNDQRRAYELISTPLGVQIDAINDEVGSSYDTSWNAIWKSAGRITADGYEVEMAIPFNQIRFQQEDGGQVWGFDAIRSYPRGQRHHIGIFPRDRGSNSYLNQTVKLTGITGVSPGKNLEVIPTVTGTRTDSRTSLADLELESGDSESDLGVSVRWGITPNMSLNAALNPDFSQIEADALQLDVNEQFALFFRETRPFFKEGADYFNTELNLVHTRSIADPSSAGKLTGKNGKHTWGVFSAQDDQTNLIVPGPEGSSGGIFDISNTSSVGRYRYDFGSNSTIGAMVTDRRGDGYSNSVISADTVYRISDTDLVKASFAQSQTEYNEEMADAFGVPTGKLTDEAVTLEYNHGVREWWVNARYDDFGDDYRSDLGFRPRVGFRSLYAGGAKIWWGEDDNPWFRKAWGASVEKSEFQDGSPLEELVSTWANARGPLESQFEGNIQVGNRVFNNREFDIRQAEAGAFVQATGDLAFSLDVGAGDWIDFTHTRPAENLFLRPSVRYTVGKHLYIHFSHIFSRLDVDGGTLFEVNAPELRLIHQFNTRAFLRLILQYQEVERDLSLYDFPDDYDAKTEDLFTQFLFTYKINPQTALYVGYSDNQLANDSFDMTRTDRTFFMKLGYALVR